MGCGASTPTLPLGYEAPTPPASPPATASPAAPTSGTAATATPRASHSCATARLRPWFAPGNSRLTLEAADEMASVALREVRERGFKDVSVCVVDDSGRTLVQKTMINCARLPPELAHAKAMLCVGMHASSRALRDKYAGVDGKAAKMPQLLAMQTVGAYAGQPLAPFPGGVLCRDSTGAVVGAIGISGAAADEDEPRRRVARDSSTARSRGRTPSSASPRSRRRASSHERCSTACPGGAQFCSATSRYWASSLKP